MAGDISLKEKASFGIGAVGKDIGYWIMAGYLMVFFTDVVQLNPAYVAFLFLFARFFDAVNDPIMGCIVDNTKTRWGKFRPWILIGTIVNCIVLIGLYWDPSSLGPVGAAAWCGVFYILWGVTYTIMDIPYWSMIPAFSSDSKVRDLMSVIPRTGAMIGGQFVVIFGLPIITWLGVNQGGTQADGFFRFAILSAVLFIIFELICVRNVREHVSTPLRQKISVKEMLRLLAKNDQLVVIIVLTIIQQIGGNLVNGTIIYYFKYALQHEDAYAYFMAAGAITQFVAFMVFPGLVAKTSRKTVYLLSGILMIVGYVGMFLFGSQADSSVYVAGGLFCIASAGNALSLVSTTVMLADTVDYGEFKLGTRSESIVFSMQTMTVKAGGAIANFLTSMTLAVIGYVPNVVQSESTIFGLRLVMFIGASACIAILLLIYLKSYKLNGEFYKNMLSALEVSREKAMAQKAERFQVHNALSENAILLNIKAQSKSELLDKMFKALENNPHIKDVEAVKKAILEREQKGPTGMADGIAIPHAKSKGVSLPQIVIATLDKGVDFNAPDGKACDLVCMIASPDDGVSHLDTLGRLSIMLNDENIPAMIRKADNAYDLIEELYKKERSL